MADTPETPAGALPFPPPNPSPATIAVPRLDPRTGNSPNVDRPEAMLKLHACVMVLNVSASSARLEYAGLNAHPHLQPQSQPQPPDPVHTHSPTCTDKGVPFCELLEAPGRQSAYASGSVDFLCATLTAVTVHPCGAGGIIRKPL